MYNRTVSSFFYLTNQFVCSAPVATVYGVFDTVKSGKASETLSPFS